MWHHSALLAQSADQNLHCLRTCSTSSAVLAVANYNRNILNLCLELAGGRGVFRLANRTLDRPSTVEVSSYFYCYYYYY